MDGPPVLRDEFCTNPWDFKTFELAGLKRRLGGPDCICVKWVPFVKLAFSLGNRAHFGSKMGLFSAFRTAFSMIVAQTVVFIVISLFPPF